MDVTLQSILEGCKKHDRASQKALYNRYFNLFMVMCLRYISSRHDAEEVLNNAFLRIFRHINKYSGEGSFEGWMKKIVVNCCLTGVSRSNYNIRSKIIPIQSSFETAEGGTFTREMGLPGDSLDEKYSQEYLLQLLSFLPETTRLVFNLYVFEEYNHKEIGSLLNMAERTSQSHLAKARKILSAGLDKKKLIHRIQRV